MTEWPFEAWLRLGVQMLRLTPEQVWQTSLCDWMALTNHEPARLSRAQLSGLMEQFPDIESSKNDDR